MSLLFTLQCDAYVLGDKNTGAVVRDIGQRTSSS